MFTVLVALLAAMLSSVTTTRSGCDGVEVSRWYVVTDATAPEPLTVSGCATGAVVTCSTPVQARAGETLTDGDALLLAAPPGTPSGTYPCALATDQGVGLFAVVVVP